MSRGRRNAKVDSRRESERACCLRAGRGARGERREARGVRLSGTGHGRIKFRHIMNTRYEYEYGVPYVSGYSGPVEPEAGFARLAGVSPN